MIKNKDRSKWFGASDTSIIMGNWNTKTFAKWWTTKLGFIKNNFTNKYISAGNFYEHKIAEKLQETIGGKMTLDRQIKVRRLRLRVNLDCEINGEVYEIKTIKELPKKVPNNYYQQVQVQMFTSKKKGCIAFYQLNEEEYKNYFLPIDSERLAIVGIEYDEEFIKEYLIKIKYLAKCLKKGVFPVWK